MHEERQQFWYIINNQEFGFEHTTIWMEDSCWKPSQCWRVLCVIRRGLQTAMNKNTAPGQANRTVMLNVLSYFSCTLFPRLNSVYKHTPANSHRVHHKVLTDKSTTQYLTLHNTELFQRNLRVNRRFLIRGKHKRQFYFNFYIKRIHFASLLLF